MSTLTAEAQPQNDVPTPSENANSHVLHPIVKQLAARRREHFAEYRSLVAHIASGTAQGTSTEDADGLLRKEGVSLAQFQEDIERGISNLSSPDSLGLRKYLADRKQELSQEHLKLSERRLEVVRKPYYFRNAIVESETDEGRELFRHYPTMSDVENAVARAQRDIKAYEQELVDIDALLGVINRQQEEIAAELRAMSERLNAAG